MQIDLPEDVVDHLTQLAQQQGVSVSELVQTLLHRYMPAPPPGSLAEMAQNAREAGLASTERVDTADHSREILTNEYAAYLKDRLDPNDHHSG